MRLKFMRTQSRGNRHEVKGQASNNKFVFQDSPSRPAETELGMMCGRADTRRRGGAKTSNSRRLESVASGDVLRSLSPWVPLARSDGSESDRTVYSDRFVVLLLLLLRIIVLNTLWALTRWIWQRRSSSSSRRRRDKQQEDKEEEEGGEEQEEDEDSSSSSSSSSFLLLLLLLHVKHVLLVITFLNCWFLVTVFARASFA